MLGSPSKSRWSYATAKTFGEVLAYGYHQEHGSRHVVRLFNTVGPRQTGLRHGPAALRRQALLGQDLTVYGDGTQSRCFAHVADTIEALIAARRARGLGRHRVQHRQPELRSRSATSPSA